jgi:uncharacterized protein YajQ (UPF0234 family)
LVDITCIPKRGCTSFKNANTGITARAAKPFKVLTKLELRLDDIIEKLSKSRGKTMPSFDIVSEVDRQELKNAVDQAQRELANRFDFKNTDSSIEQKELILTIRTSSEDRLRALKLLLEEKFVKRQVSLKGIEWGKVEQATGESVRQIVTIKVGINSDKAKEINKLIKEKAPKGISSQTQGEQVRVTGKKRDDLQETMALLKAASLDLPIQFENFRD